MHQSCPLARHQIIQARDIFIKLLSTLHHRDDGKIKKKKKNQDVFSTLTFSTTDYKSLDWSNLNSTKVARRIEWFDYVTNDLNSKVDVIREGESQ